jgi:transcriptional regulator with XRE-family HTH domain
MPTLRINHEGFDEACTSAGLYNKKAIARRMEIDQATLSRVTNGQATPGPRFIAGALRAFGTSWFAQLFKVVD